MVKLAISQLKLMSLQKVIKSLKLDPVAAERVTEPLIKPWGGLNSRNYDPMLTIF